MFDRDKQYETRDGRKARFLGRLQSNKLKHLNVFAVFEKDGTEYTYRYDDNGKGTHFDSWDIIPSPVRKREYRNCFVNGIIGEPLDSRPPRPVSPSLPRFAVLELIYEDGVVVGMEIYRDY